MWGKKSLASPLDRLNNIFYKINITTCTNVYLTTLCLRFVDGNCSPFTGPYFYERTRNKLKQNILLTATDE